MICSLIPSVQMSYKTLLKYNEYIQYIVSTNFSSHESLGCLGYMYIMLRVLLYFWFHFQLFF